MHVVYRGIFKLLALATIAAVTTSVAFYLAVSTDDTSLSRIAVAGLAIVVLAKLVYLIRLIGNSIKRPQDSNRNR
jgi:hypothetical protein